MDWATYKSLCDQPDYWSRWMLRQTARLLEIENRTELASRLSAFQDNSPLDKPDDHRGPSDSDMLQLALSADECRQILEVVTECAEFGRTTPETSKRGLGGFVEAWAEYSESLSRE